MSLFNQSLFDAVVLFENKNGHTYNGVATGFLIGFQNQHKKDTFHTFIITNKHVFDGKADIYISFDSETEKRKRVNVNLQLPKVGNTWFQHRYKDVDLALLPVSINTLKTNFGTSQRWIPEQQFLYMKDYDSQGLCAGDGLYFLGFPLGLSGKLKNSPVIRMGVLARHDKELLKQQKAIMIDGQNFPGNSGGPVFTKPELATLSGTKNIDQNLLIGVIKSYLPHKNFYIDPSNGSISAISVENSGLGLFVPMDYAKQIYDAWIKSGKPTHI